MFDNFHCLLISSICSIVLSYILDYDSFGYKEYPFELYNKFI